MSFASMNIGDLEIGRTTYRNVMIVTGSYEHGGGTALSLYSEGEPLATVTVNAEGDPRRGPKLWGKGWSENEGLLEALEEKGVLKITGTTRPSGFVQMTEIELIGDYIALQQA